MTQKTATYGDKTLVIPDNFGVCDEGIRHVGRQLLRQSVYGASEPTPFRPLSLDPIHMQGYRNLRRLQHGKKHRISRIHHHRSIEVLLCGVEAGQESMYRSVQVLGADGGQDHQVYSSIFPQPARSVLTAAIDRDAVTRFDQSD